MRLTLLRHAKSDWSNQRLSDFERPLNARGNRDAPAMGKLLYQRRFSPQAIICSSAARARQTANFIAQAIYYKQDNIEYADDLYLASSTALLQYVAKTATAATDVLLVGHNPGMTELANWASDTRIDNLPTCSIFSITADIDNWLQLRDQPGHCDWFLTPKRDLH